MQTSPLPHVQSFQVQPIIPIYYQYAAVPAPRKRRPLRISDKNGGEKIRVFKRLSGFVAKESMVWMELTRRFGDNLKHGELLSIAEVVSVNANILLDRDAKRRKTVLIKWFQENWAQIHPFLNYVVLEDKNKDKPIINGDQNFVGLQEDS